MYDLLIKGGILISPDQHLHDKSDLAIEKGRIAAMDADISPDHAREVLDVHGYIVTPGLIDSHVHVYPGVSHYGIDPDLTCLAKGVTTVVDAGSSGAGTFDGLRKYIIDVSETRILAFLNISILGLVSSLSDELENLKHADPERAIRVCERNRDVIQGIKVRMGKAMVGNNGLRPLKRALRAAEALGMPIMVHPGDTPVPLGEILSEMRTGDILTHCFHGREHGIFDENGELLPEVEGAIKTGVIFDVGHGVGSFSFDIAEKALALGIAPGTISSDLHFYNVCGPVFDLATTLSKFLLLGMSLDEVLARSTTMPARLFGLSESLGSLKEGYLADIAVFKVCEGAFEFVDSMKESRLGEQKLVPVAVIRAGKIYWSSIYLGGRSGSRARI